MKTAYQQLNIKPTKVTPLVRIDPSDVVMLEFRGVSSPRSSVEFYAPIIEKLRRLPVSVSGKIDAHFALEYFNTSSSKCLFDIMKIISTYKKQGVEITINWYYEAFDDDMKETGEDYENVLGLKFNYVAT